MKVGNKKLDPDWKFRPGMPKVEGSGRQPLLHENYGVKKLCPEDIKRSISRIFQMTEPQMADHLKNQPHVFDVALISCTQRAIDTGDFGIIEAILVRLLGRPRDQEVINGNDEPLQALVNISPAELISYLRSQKEAEIDAEAIAR